MCQFFPYDRGDSCGGYVPIRLDAPTICLTNKELEIIRLEQVEIPEGRLKAVVEETTRTLPVVRTLNFPKFAETVIQRLSPTFPERYTSLLQFATENRPNLPGSLRFYGKIKENKAQEAKMQIILTL